MDEDGEADVVMLREDLGAIVASWFGAKVISRGDGWLADRELALS